MDTIRSAEVVLPCDEIGPTLDFFTRRLGFEVEGVFPAEDPRAVLVAGHWLRLRLERGADGPPGLVRVACSEPSVLSVDGSPLRAPNGTRIEVVRADQGLTTPPLVPALAVTPLGPDAPWTEGRAGMLYRDLIPGRQGGRFVASHIRIPTAGPVSDYVHHHDVRFQLIHCWRGGVRVVYEDQGEPFWLEPGDTVLQPPGIRHQVLETHGETDVIELTSPADHATWADRSVRLPSREPRPERTYGGQRFVRSQPVPWRTETERESDWRWPGYRARDTGIGEATEGLAGVRVVRTRDTLVSGKHLAARVHRGELLFWFVLAGRLTVELDGHAHTLREGAACVVPPGMPHAVVGGASLRLLESTFPAVLPEA